MAKGKPTTPHLAALNRDGLARRILAALKEQGWRVVPSRHHLLCYPPDRAQRIVAHSATPRGGVRATENWLADLRRSGFAWEG
jgi:hypothetical protein